jgi:thioredoxin reductase
MTARHRVVIVGGGFGGLAAAKALRRARVDVRWSTGRCTTSSSRYVAAFDATPSIKGSLQKEQYRLPGLS